jgi:hypothetical protein
LRQLCLLAGLAIRAGVCFCGFSGLPAPKAQTGPMFRRELRKTLRQSLLMCLGLRLDPLEQLLKLVDMSFEIGFRLVPGFAAGLLQFLQLALD